MSMAAKILSPIGALFSAARPKAAPAPAPRSPQVIMSDAADDAEAETRRRILARSGSLATIRTSRRGVLTEPVNLGSKTLLGG